MTGLVLTDEVVAPERDVVLEERRMRTDADPAARLSEAMSAALFLNHPYRFPVIGWEHEIRALNRDDAIAFYERFYTPSNAILIVAGDVDAAEVRTLAEATYGKVPNRFTPAPRLRPQEPPPIAARRLSLADARVRQPTVTRTYQAPSYATATGPTAHALELLATILGGGSTSRLYRALVVDQGIAASAATYYWGTSLDRTRFGIYATLRPDVSHERIEAAIDAEIKRLIEDGVTAAELERAKTRLVAETIYDRDSQSSLARAFGSALTTGGTVKDVVEWPDRVRAVTAEQVQAAAHAVLDIRASVTGWLESAPAGETK